MYSIGAVDHAAYWWHQIMWRSDMFDLKAITNELWFGTG